MSQYCECLETTKMIHTNETYLDCSWILDHIQTSEEMSSHSATSPTDRTSEEDGQTHFEYFPKLPIEIRPQDMEGRMLHSSQC
jgi:hypothetical protein